ncbi:MAG: 50S ribosomal protein L19e [Candidatus Micrarchaeota archaeon]|nr:50S ribosomal protein L19e [Candidatus Micrarchaeota archaeon]
MNIATFKRLASDIFGVGQNRIKIKEGREVLEILKAEIVRREDVKARFHEIAYIVPAKGRRRKKKEREQGPGRRKGTKYSRLPKKKQWMMKIRALRKLIKQLHQEGKIDTRTKNDVYRKAKGGYIRSKRFLLNYLKSNNLLKGDVDV